MWKKKNRTNLKLALSAILLSLACTLFLSCEKGAPLYSYESHEFFLENSRGAYTYGEILMPQIEEPCPLVFIAHGFKGTLNSGGALELSQKLASRGIAAVRIDFDAYLEESNTSQRTREYTLTDMTQDTALAIEHILSSYSIDSTRLGVYGRSMGGRLAMIMANENINDFDFKAMVLIAPAGNDSAMIHYMGGEERWQEMKEEALKKGFCEKQGLKLSYKWFTDFEAYNPDKTGEKFGEKPVLVYYNTLDNVVLPQTSLECAKAYNNVEIIEVTTEDGHGYEMGFEQSSLKDEIMDRVVEFFSENLIIPSVTAG